MKKLPEMVKNSYDDRIILLNYGRKIMNGDLNKFVGAASEKKLNTAQVMAVTTENMTPTEQAWGRVRHGLSPADLNYLQSNSARFPIEAKTPLSARAIAILQDFKLKNLDQGDGKSFFDLLLSTGVVIQRGNYYFFLSYYKDMLNTLWSHIVKNETDIVEQFFMTTLTLHTDSPFELSLNQGEAQIGEKLTIIYRTAVKELFSKYDNTIQQVPEVAESNNAISSVSPIFIGLNLFLDGLESDSTQRSLFSSIFQEPYRILAGEISDKVKEVLNSLSVGLAGEKAKGTTADRNLLIIVAAADYFQLWVNSLSNAELKYADLVRDLITEKLNSYPDQSSYPELISRARSRLLTRKIKHLTPM